MKYVCILLPAFIAVAVKNNRGEKKDLLGTILSFGLWTLLLNLINMILITYVLRMDGVTADALESFSFAIKYIVVGSVMAFVLPYVFEIVSKYLHIDFKVEVADENK